MKISVVMPSFNQGQFVAAAIESVLRQDHPDTELILVDGGSTDNTKEVIQSYRDRIAVCISEPDRGQSDALRKGFECATGDVFTWLSTDDLLLPGTLSEVDRLMAGPSCDWVLGNVIWIDVEDRVIRCWRAGSMNITAQARLGALAAGGPSAFFRRDLYFRTGGVDLDLHYTMDTDLWWRFVISGASSKRLNQYTWGLRLHENSKVSGHLFEGVRGDTRHREVAKKRAAEARIIRDRTSSFLWPLPKPLPRLISMTQRLTSASYLRGRYETLSWRGKNIWEVVSTP